MPDLDLGAIRAYCEAATAGPWISAYWPLPKPYHWVGVPDENPLQSRLAGRITGPIEKQTDAEFIARARTDLPALLALVETLAEALEETVAVLKGQLIRDLIVFASVHGWRLTEEQSAPSKAALNKARIALGRVRQ